MTSQPAEPFRPFRREPKATTKPRRVLGGIKPGSTGDEPSAWAASRWRSLAERLASPGSLAEGIEYAHLGQTRTLEVRQGQIDAVVQGRLIDPYRVTIRVPLFPLGAPEEAGNEPQGAPDGDGAPRAGSWERAIMLMGERVRFAAALLSGELPEGIEDLFVAAGLKLFAVEASDLAVSCSCARHRSPTAPPPDPSGWCKHVVCVVQLVADRCATDPYLMFQLRGMPRDDLIESLRQRRAASGVSAGEMSPVFRSHVPGVSDAPITPLEDSIHRFYEAGRDLDEIDMPIRAPEVTHPILRRLGPSPFETPATLTPPPPTPPTKSRSGRSAVQPRRSRIPEPLPREEAPKARFPLVGLLATCYDIASAWAIRGGPEKPEEESEPGALARDVEGSGTEGSGDGGTHGDASREPRAQARDEE